MRKDLTLITGNSYKATQIGKYLNYPIKHQKLDLVEIQSFEIEEILEHKVREAFNKIKRPVLVDDVSVIFNSLGKLPGPFIKWFANSLTYPKICQMLSSFKDRSSTVSVGISYYDGKKLNIFIGEITGRIADKPAGKRGFGWDVVFIPDGYNVTRAQMNEEDYDKTSPRRMALEKLYEFLKNE